MLAIGTTSALPNPSLDRTLRQPKYSSWPCIGWDRIATVALEPRRRPGGSGGPSLEAPGDERLPRLVLLLLLTD